MNDYLKQQINQIEQKIAEAKALEDDPELAELARQDLKKLEIQKTELERLLIQQSAANSPQSADDGKAVILEIRAAAGGNEAGLFAADLLRMYQRFAQSKGLQVEELDRSEGGIGNIKEVILKISGSGAYQLFQNESGVHRVQRVPKTEGSGRIHTSTATVVVMPEIPESQFHLDPKEIEFEAYRSSGHGGQNVQKVSTAVRLRHKPTGIVVTCQTERQQARNRELAMNVLRSRLYQLEEEKKQKAESQARRVQVGTGERSEKIRTYNFPQNRVTDHRINKSWYNLEEILNGNLDPIIKASNFPNQQML